MALAHHFGSKEKWTGEGGGGGGRERERYFPLSLNPLHPSARLESFLPRHNLGFSFIFQNGDRVTRPSKLPKLELFPDGH